MLRIASLLLVLACTGCSRPEPPQKERPPEPQAQHDTDLRDMIQRPIDKAKAVEPQVLEAAKRQREEIDAQVGGDAPQPATPPDN